MRKYTNQTGKHIQKPQKKEEIGKTIKLSHQISFFHHQDKKEKTSTLYESQTIIMDHFLRIAQKNLPPPTQESISHSILMIAHKYL